MGQRISNNNDSNIVVDMEGSVVENSSDDTLDRSEDEVALQSCCSPKKMPYRFLGLALMCLLGFGTELMQLGENTTLFVSYKRRRSLFIVLSPRQNGVTVKRMDRSSQRLASENENRVISLDLLSLVSAISTLTRRMYFTSKLFQC